MKAACIISQAVNIIGLHTLYIRLCIIGHPTSYEYNCTLGNYMHMYIHDEYDWSNLNLLDPLIIILHSTYTQLGEAGSAARLVV